MTNKLIKLLEEKKNLISEFLKISKEQTEAIKAKEYEKLLDLINKRESIIQQVNEINSKAKDILEADDPRVNNLLQSINDLVEQTIAIEKENQVQINILRDEMAVLLKNARKTKASHSLYRGKNIAIEGVLLDKKK